MTNVERCRRGFINDPSCASCRHVEESIIHVLRDCASAQEVWRQRNLWVFQRVGSNNYHTLHSTCITKQRRDQVWNPPPLRFIKLNTDEARDPVLKEASIVAMARDDLGSWRGRVRRNIGKCNLLRLAWDNSWDNIMVETDCPQAMEAILDRSYGKLYRDLTSRIQELYSKRSQCNCTFVGWEDEAFPYALIIS
ncbi:hypothetical protein ES332_D03G069700v1 [Gossypium tomentosum]|uniref:RNase H type-1 domain-containing protein n=1 Tax=Gossypium tomentosum TaxID=34277 RepID=A0A5D2LJM9_GOSTO|nr:hypothetical protein ES332_D03G069700v1 [Gossypium tomentosum]